MMLVKCELRPSSIHGLGLFTTEDVSVGQLVWRFAWPIDIEISRAEYAALPISTREFLDRYTYRRSIRIRVLCGDLAKFMNHSETPSVLNDHMNQDDRAARHLHSGEEITCNYRVFDLDWQQKLGVPSADWNQAAAQTLL